MVVKIKGLEVDLIEVDDGLHLKCILNKIIKQETYNFRQVLSGLYEKSVGCWICAGRVDYECDYVVQRLHYFPFYFVDCLKIFNLLII